MSFRGVSAKKVAKDIADGFLNLTVANLRKYSPQELKTMLVNISMVQREVRQEQPAEDDYAAIKKKNWRLQNLSRTHVIIQNFIKHRRIKI